ncbi:Fatty acid-binding protein [Mycena venus]|uniref:Fatty acid-binding protein n=1 Tax=Mycena venus TaxID=2733690 RepID=A0A8H6WXL3_9AGAR|nr:Fatty acid-binding protein [Mycena venus]
MSDDLKVPGFQASELIAGINTAFANMPDAEKAAQIKKACAPMASFSSIRRAPYTKAPAKTKADVTIILSDETLTDLASGKTNGQKAFMTGKLKTKGNMMLATKLGDVLNL